MWCDDTSRGKHNNNYTIILSCIFIIKSLEDNNFVNMDYYRYILQLI